jgi:hypothetical protein
MRPHTELEKHLWSQHTHMYNTLKQVIEVLVDKMFFAGDIPVVRADDIWDALEGWDD